MNGTELGKLLIVDVYKRQILDGLLVVCPQLPFEVHCHDVAELGYQFQLGNLQVQALPVEHRVSCLAYSLSLPRAGKFDAVCLLYTSRCV